MKINLRRVFSNWLFITVALLLFIKPNYFDTIHYLNSIYTYGRYMIFAILLFITLHYMIHNKNSSRIIYLLVLYLIFLLISTLLNDGNIITIKDEAIMVLGLGILFDYCSQTNVRKFIDILYLILFLYIIINFITLIKYPNGLYTSSNGDISDYYWQNWFLGFKNYPIRLFIPALCIGELRCYIKGKIKLDFIIMFVIIWISCLLLNSSTALIGISIYTLGTIFIHNFKKLRRIVNIYTVLGVGLLLFVFIVVMQGNSPIVIAITEFFKKDITFTGRTVIWLSSIECILNKFLLGYGVFTGMEFQSFTGTAGTHPHNIILYILFRGGIVSFIIFIRIFILVAKKLKRYNSEYLAYNFYLLFLCFIIMGLTESILNSAVLLLPMFVLAYNSNYIYQAKKYYEDYSRAYRERRTL